MMLVVPPIGIHAYHMKRRDPNGGQPVDISRVRSSDSWTDVQRLRCFCYAVDILKTVQQPVFIYAPSGSGKSHFTRTGVCFCKEDSTHEVITEFKECVTLPEPTDPLLTEKLIALGSRPSYMRDVQRLTQIGGLRDVCPRALLLHTRGIWFGLDTSYIGQMLCACIDRPRVVFEDGGCVALSGCVNQRFSAPWSGFGSRLARVIVRKNGEHSTPRQLIIHDNQIFTGSAKRIVGIATFMGFEHSKVYKSYPQLKCNVFADEKSVVGLGVSMMCYEPGTQMAITPKEFQYQGFGTRECCTQVPRYALSTGADHVAGSNIAIATQFFNTYCRETIVCFDLNGVLAQGHSRLYSATLPLLQKIVLMGCKICVFTSWGRYIPIKLRKYCTIFDRTSCAPCSSKEHPLRVMKGPGSLIPWLQHGIIVVDDTPDKWPCLYTENDETYSNTHVINVLSKDFGHTPEGVSLTDVGEVKFEDIKEFSWASQLFSAVEFSRGSDPFRVDFRKMKFEKESLTLDIN